MYRIHVFVYYFALRTAVVFEFSGGLVRMFWRHVWWPFFVYATWYLVGVIGSSGRSAWAGFQGVRITKSEALSEVVLVAPVRLSSVPAACRSGIHISPVEIDHSHRLNAGRRKRASRGTIWRSPVGRGAGLSFCLGSLRSPADLPTKVTATRSRLPQTVVRVIPHSAPKVLVFYL